MNQPRRPWLFALSSNTLDEQFDSCATQQMGSPASWAEFLNVWDGLQPDELIDQTDGIHFPQEDDISPQTAESNHTCFGALPEILVRLRKSPNIMSPTPAVCKFSVASIGKYYGLEEADVGVFGIFEKKQCQAMQQLLAIDGVQIAAYVTSKVLNDASSSYTHRKPTVMLVEVNIYGPRGVATEVGRVLSSFSKHLQQPLFGLDDSRHYYNPHFFHVEEVLGFSVAMTPFLPISLPQLPNEPGPRMRIQTHESPTHVDADDEVTRILGTLSHSTLQNRLANERIRTPLQDHQMKALDFFSQRESGTLSYETALWKEMEDETGNNFYQHVICGTRRSRPMDILGGILADEMGLGKTIVALSIIASSLTAASEFGSGEIAKDDELAERRRSRATLVLVPSTLLLDSWVTQIYEHIHPGALKFYRYHGQKRDEDVEQLFQSDIVLTTYATLAFEGRRDRSLLQRVEWFRLILDEAHDIRNRATKIFRIVTSLEARHRWCLTGTPIQNSLDDLGALVSFLKLPLLENMATFQRFIAGQNRSTTRPQFANLQTLLEAICLRRTKDVVGILDPVVEWQYLELSSDERRVYNELLQRYESIIDMHVSGHGKGANTAKVQSFLKLRLFCNNGTLLATGSSDPDEVLSYLQQIDQAICASCSQTIYSIDDSLESDGGVLFSACSHLVCRACVSQDSACRWQCPICLSSIQNSSAQYIPGKHASLQADPLPSTVMPYPPSNTAYPTKLLAFLRDIEQQTAQKSIVFSSWTKTLRLIAELLKTNTSLPHYLIHGGIPFAKRTQMLADFQSSSQVNILLMTLGTGAVGLNLASASRIYLMEPQWNPAMEQQAFGRALRIGQTQKVTLIRYIMRNTVEDSNVLSRQQTKIRLASGGFRERMAKMVAMK